MPEMSFLSSDSQSSNKTLRESELSTLFIKKPNTLYDSCPVKTTTQRLPLIEGKFSKKEENKKTMKSSSSKELWLKPGISLPKLQPKEVPPFIGIRRQETIESFRSGDFNSVTWFKNADPNSDGAHEHEISKSIKCYENVGETTSEKDAIVCSEAVGPSECQLLFTVPSSELKFQDFEDKEEKSEESHALQRWEYWLKQNKHLQEYLSKHRDKKKCGFQFGNRQNYGTIKDEKTLFLLAQIPATEKWRENQGKSGLEVGEIDKSIFIEKTGMKYNKVKVLKERKKHSIGFIGFPTLIKKEKGLIDTDILSQIQSEQDWKKLGYGKGRIKNLHTESKTPMPHIVEVNELAIVGKKIQQKQKEEVKAPVTREDLPTIKVTPVSNEDSCSVDFPNDHSSVFCLTIGKKELKYKVGNKYCQNIKKKDINLEWEIDFGVNAVGVLVERILRVENKGTMTVKYKFLSPKTEKMHSLNSLQLKQHEPWFFFNKNSGLFLPGQIYNLKFYHYTKRSGVRKEIWHLKTKPPLLKSEESGSIIFWAVSIDNSLDSEINALESYLRKRVTQSIIDFILQIILKKVFNPLEGLRNIEYRSFFIERQLFEFQNPKHYYHSTVLRKLRGLFEQIIQKKQSEWDLSLLSLIELITANTKGKEQDFLLRQIAENAKKLYRPNYLFIKNIKKYRMTYGILCKMTNLMEEDHNYLRNCFSQKKEPEKAKSEYEDMDEECINSSVTEEKGASEVFELYIQEDQLEIKPINFLLFQAIFYLKVYQHLCEAIEHIAGALETNKLSEFRK